MEKEAVTIDARRLARDFGGLWLVDREDAAVINDNGLIGLQSAVRTSTIATVVEDQ